MAWRDLFRDEVPEISADDAADIRLRLGLTDADASLSIGGMVKMILGRIEALEREGFTVASRSFEDHPLVRSIETRLKMLESKHSTLKLMFDRWSFRGGRGGSDGAHT
jgi:hypothetical protein